MKLFTIKKPKIKKLRSAKINTKAAGAPTDAKASSYGKDAKKRMASFRRRFK